MGEEQAGGMEMDVDALLASVESQDTGGDRPMTQQEPEAPTQAQDQLFYEFTASGKPVKVAANDPNVTKWLSQGHAYSQNMHALNQKEAQIRQQEQMFQALQERYGPIDEYVQKNPEFWDLVQKQWESRGQVYDPNNPLARDLIEVKQKLSEIDQFKSSLEQEKQTQRAQEEDKALDGEIESIRKDYPDINLDTVQPDGQSLMYHVLKYANDRGIKSFQDAFLAYNHKQLLSIAQERAKESVNKDIQKKTKLGILGSSPTPTKGITKAQNVKDKSYEALLQEALQEAGVG